MFKRFSMKASAVGKPAGFVFFGFLLFVVFLPHPARSHDDLPKIASITFQGNEAIDSDVIASWMRAKVASDCHAQLLHDDSDRIIAGYAAEGFFFATVDSIKIVESENRRVVHIMIVVNEGPPAIIESVTVRGNRAVRTSDLLAALSMKAGDRFIPRLFEADVQRVLQTYEHRGFPLAKIVVDDIGFEKDRDKVTVSPALSLEEGALALITELRIEGNESTKDFVIARESRIASGEVFTRDVPAKIKRRLEKLQLFSSVALPELYLREDGSAGLTVRVTEGNQNRFDGVVGYVPPSRSEKSGSFTGLVDLQFRNLLGTGRKLMTRWYRENRSSEEIELRYLEPWVASYPVNVRGDFFQRKQDTTYVRRRYELNGELMVSEQFALGLSFSQANVIPSVAATATLVARSRTTSYGITASFDSRNDPVTPSQGVQYRAEFANGRKSIEQSSQNDHEGTNSTQRAALDLDHFVSPLNNHVVAFSVHLREFRSASTEASDLFRLGGATTLRGYREAQFLGSRIVWMNLEYRILVGLRSYVYGIFDAGHIALPNRPAVGLTGATQNKIGYGVGLQMDSSLGLVGVSLALGEGDTFSTAKLHFRLVNEF